MFPVTDNPAERLWRILTEAKDSNAGSVNDAFSKVLGYKADDKICFYRTMGYLNELLDSVESKIRKIPDIKHELYLRDIPVVRSVITPSSMGDNWGAISTPLKQGALTCLEFCAEVLGKQHQEAEISQEEIAKIKSRISSLYKVVAESDIDPDLKIVIFDLLTTIQSAIDNYKIKGVEGLKRSLVYASGLINLHTERFKKAKHIPSIKEVFVFFKDVAIIVTAAYKMKELGHTVGGFLGLGTGEDQTGGE